MKNPIQIIQEKIFGLYDEVHLLEKQSEYLIPRSIKWIQIETLENILKEIENNQNTKEDEGKA